MGRRQLYRMGEIAAATGVSRQTLHAWARLGLLRPRETTAGGHRLFPASVVRRIEEIRALRATRSLEEIRRLLGVGRDR